MNAIVGIQHLAWLILWLAAMAFVKIRYPDTLAGKTVAVLV